MGSTGVSWTDFTHNPWWGCHRVSPGCRDCFADFTTKFRGFPGLWHKNGPRRMLSDNLWAQPRKWNRQTELRRELFKVFSGTMADVFEDHPQVMAA
jgi:protein gp37